MDNNMENTIVKSGEQFLSPCSSSMGDVFGNPWVLPRVGDQYQAEIPPLMMDSNPQRLIQKPTDCPNYYAVGLPIPIMWEKGKVGSIRVEAEVINKPLHTPLDNGEEEKKTKIEIHLGTSQEKKTKSDQAENAYPLPRSLGEPWMPIEHDSFLLGLYIFGKNLRLVKMFVKSKEMGDILSYYYGKFYRSDEHRRWSGKRKLRSRRCINGHKIFTGWRLQELLSRLFSRVSEECRIMLREVSGEFGEGKCSLEEYVFTLKDTVGINILVEAVAIGKGKQDLTGTSMDPTVKTNNTMRGRPEIPMGKACSSLTSAEIIKILTGDFRLSKARSNDLFWEAVWPLLLERGWHSEQPKKDNGFVSSKKHPLVYLIPGVEKFSRRRLVKGNHYFDCVSDVLNKVASDPGLLEDDTETVKAGERKCQDSLANWQRHCYLQPRVSNCNGDLAKFTIVDTSLIQQQSKVRELRTLPGDTRNISTLSDLSSETEEQDSSEESQYKSEEIIALNCAEDTTENGTFNDSSEFSRIQDNSFADLDTKRKEEESSSRGLKSPEFEGGPCQTLFACSSLAQGNPNKSDNFLFIETYPKKPQSLTLIDLNLPLVAEETNETVHGGANNIEQQPAALSGGRRQSTRNRPLTTKALEAIACGFLSTRRKRKRVETG